MSSQIRFAAAGPAGGIYIDNEGCGPAAWGVITRIALEAGGTFEQGHILLEAGTFRKVAQSLARACRQNQIRASYDDAVRGVLQQHLEETKALRTLRDGLLRVDVPAVACELDALSMWHPPQPLKDQQLNNIARLSCMMHGANFSVPGAGKTRTTLGLHALIQGRGQVDRLLIVGPKNAFGSWEEEVGRCMSSARVARLMGGKAVSAEILRTDPHIVLVTYQLLPNVIDSVMAWMRRGKVHLVLDESHRIKAGEDATYAKAVLRLACLALRRDILTGTPLPHSTRDLVGQLDFLWPGQQIMPAPEPADGYLSRTQEAVRPLYVRTTKKELGLPKIDVVLVPVSLGPLQREIYDALRNKVREQFGSVGTLDRSRFRALGRSAMRLLQAASNPALFVTQDITFELEPMEIPKGSRLWDLSQDYARYERPAKVWAAIKRAEELAEQGQKTLIWSSFVPNVEGIADHLAHLGAVYIHGQVPSSEGGEPDTREGIIRRFHEDPDCWVLVANPAAASEGISLHRVCHHSIYVDRSFNAAHFLQSLDRIHRLGLPEDVTTTVEVLTAAETIDDAVRDSLHRKVLTMAAVLEDQALAELAYDPEDVIERVPGGLDRQDIMAVIDHLLRGGHSS